MPIFTATKGTPLLGKTQLDAAIGATNEGPYRTWLRDMSDVAGWPESYRYALFTSTDHDATRAGLYMFVRGALDGTFTGFADSAVQTAFANYKTAVGSSISITKIFDYANDANAAGGVTDGGETWWIEPFGSTWVAWGHADNLGTEQSTFRVTGTSPLTLSLPEADSIVFPQESDAKLRFGDGHDGYVRGPIDNRDRIFDYDHDWLFISLYGGTDYSANALWGCDDPGDPADEPTLLRIFGKTNIAGMDSGQFLIWTQINPNTIVPLPTGEIALMMPAAMVASSTDPTEADIYQVIVDRKFRVTREVVKVLERGGASAADEGSVTNPQTIGTGNSRVGIYEGENAANTANTVIGLTVTIDATAALPDPISRPNHDKYDYSDWSSLPAAIVDDSPGAGSISVSAGKLVLTAGIGNPAVARVDTPTLDLTTGSGVWFEIEVYGFVATDLTTPRQPRICIADGSGTAPANGFIPRTFNTKTGYAREVYASDPDGGGPLAAGDRTHDDGVWLPSSTHVAGLAPSINGIVGVLTRVANSTVDDADMLYKWGANEGQGFANQEIGFVITPSAKTLALRTNGDAIFPTLTYTANLTPTAAKVYFHTGDADATIDRIVIRKATGGAGVAPTFTAEAFAGYVDVTLNKACIGLSGFTLQKDDGGYSDVTTTAERISDTVIRLRSTELAGGDTVRARYAGSGDVRSFNDLVEVQTANGNDLSYISTGGYRTRLSRLHLLGLLE